jgi:hypothetical protein
LQKPHTSHAILSILNAFWLCNYDFNRRRLHNANATRINHGFNHCHHASVGVLGLLHFNRGDCTMSRTEFDLTYRDDVTGTFYGDDLTLTFAMADNGDVRVITFEQWGIEAYVQDNGNWDDPHILDLAIRVDGVFVAVSDILHVISRSYEAAIEEDDADIAAGRDIKYNPRVL